jgi:hypothetical protein
MERRCAACSISRPRTIHGTPNVEARIGSTDNVRLSTYACAILWLMGLWMRRLGRALVVLVVLLGLLYVGDWVVLRVRVSHGTAYRVISVNQFLATPLKGNKVEYDLMGTVPVTCSRSIFPQQGNPACWWLEKHTSQWE